jgi:hypothetical protein
MSKPYPISLADCTPCGYPCECTPFPAGTPACTRTKGVASSSARIRTAPQPQQQQQRCALPFWRNLAPCILMCVCMYMYPLINNNIGAPSVGMLLRESARARCMRPYACVSACTKLMRWIWARLVPHHIVSAHTRLVPAIIRSLSVWVITAAAAAQSSIITTPCTAPYVHIYI